MEITIKKFEALSTVELYKIAQLRQEVFMLEQKIYYIDFDGKDMQCYHVLGSVNDEIVAYCRIVPKGLAYADYISFGRVLVAKKYRQNHFGKLLMQQTIAYCVTDLQEKTIKISAQIEVEKFYQNLGFTSIGSPYIEAGISHIAMLYSVG